ncbi:MAG TPA: sugar kinase [Jiangellaceae bacterium]
MAAQTPDETSAPAHPDVLSLGEAMVELSAREQVRLRDARTFDLGWGGDTSNVAVAVSRLGRASSYVTRVGDDEFGANLLDLWRHEGVDTTGVGVDPGRPTGLYLLSRPPEGPHSFTYYRAGSAASAMQPADLPTQLLRRARIVHTSGITQAIGAGPCDAAFAALRTAREAGVTTSYDPNLRPALWSLDRAQAVIMATLALADIALPSLEDARALTGLDDPGAIADELLGKGPQVVALKLGAAGALVADADRQTIVAPFEVAAVDPAGAGDTFDAAFLTAWLDGNEPAECAEFANAAAALTTTGVGCVGPIPTREAVDELRAAQGRRTRSRA